MKTANHNLTLQKSYFSYYYYYYLGIVFQSH